MTKEVERLATQFEQAERAFELVVIEGKSLREAAELLNVSKTTVDKYVRGFGQYASKALSSTPIEERRAVTLKRLEALYSRAVKMADKLAADNKGMAAVGALNAAISTFSHIRPVTGVDYPKNMNVQETVTIRFWDDEVIEVRPVELEPDYSDEDIQKWKDERGV